MAKILLIDDDLDFSRLLQRALAARGHQVQYLERATQGPDVLANEEFDLLLLDNRMPGMSGIEFLHALQESGSSALVILMTSHGTTETAIRAMNLGAFDYLIKPVVVDELVVELEPLIGKAVEMGLVAKQPVRLPSDSEACEADMSRGQAPFASAPLEACCETPLGRLAPQARRRFSTFGRDT